MRSFCYFQLFVTWNFLLGTCWVVRSAHIPCAASEGPNSAWKTGLSKQSTTSCFGNTLKVAPPWQRWISMEPGEGQSSLDWTDHSLCRSVHLEANSCAPFASKKLLASCKECNSPTHHQVMHGFWCEASHSRSRSVHFTWAQLLTNRLKALHTFVAAQMQSLGQISRCPSPDTNTLSYLNTFSTVFQMYEGSKHAIFATENVLTCFYFPFC